MRAALQRAWLGRGPLACALWPVSLLYRLVVALRKAMYAIGLVRTERSHVPVIVVGNVIVGGAGKTPVVIEVVKHLRERGLRVGVVSRGYGRSSDECLPVHPDSNPSQVGDEPVLVARRTNAPMYVASRRAAAVDALVTEHPMLDAIVSDDGMQHLAMHRDIEICVFDQRGIGNGWLLPAGPLREPWPREVDFVLDTNNVHRSLADHAVRADGEQIPLDRLRGKPLHAIAGIANPEAFFTMLRERGLQLARTTAVPDHADLAHMTLPAADTLVCTEKDATKLWRAHPDAWAVPLQVRIDPTFWPLFDHAVNAKLSSRHGPETA